MAFKITIEPEAMGDIQKGIYRYNELQRGLGRTFYAEVKASFKNLEINPFFQIRYDNVHCLTLKKSPYMIHFTINEKDNLVAIRAVFNTSRNPEIWTKR